MYGKNAWAKYKDESLNKLNVFANDYISFISKNKIEREFVNGSVKLLEEKGFVNIDKVKTIKSGDKIYVINKKKNVLAFIIGKKPISEGMRILGAHIDSPRLDIKQNPLYEKNGFALLDTHYYGGIKKYQWVTIPLALHGVIVLKNGKTVEVNIGEEDNDPIFGISDLLVHLAADQLAKTASLVIEGENLDITLGSIPLEKEDKDAVKANIIKMLNVKYGIVEEDFLSAEIEAVPAGKAREYGLDRSMIAGYGHDDKCCAYTSLRALLDFTGVPLYTSCCQLVDKEEIGSAGATGATSLFFENALAKLAHLLKEENPLWASRLSLENSMMLSSDVSAGFDPLFASVNEPKNSCYLGNGIVFNKYTGSRGKSGCSDANPEYIAYLRDIFDSHNVNWQTAELGKVDQGGGGTIAQYLAKYNMDVIDAGIAVLNMHAPMEIISKVDLFETYLAYKVFLGEK